MSEGDGLQVSEEFARRVARMTNAEMKRCSKEWGQRIESGSVPEERLAVARQQLMYLRDRIEQRIKDEPHPRAFRV